MISNHLKNVFSLSRPKRDILWLGEPNQEPPHFLKNQLAKIQFLPFARFKKEHLSQARVLILSGEAILNSSDDQINDILESVEPHLLRYLVFSGSDEKINVSIRSLINALGFEKIFILPEDSEELLVHLNTNIAEKPIEPKQVPLDTKAVKNLEHEFMDLEQLANESTEHIASAKREIELKVNQVRKLIRFLEELASLHSIEELMLLIRNELKEFHHLKDPVLVISPFNKPIEVFYIQGAQVYKRAAEKMWPVIVQARFNDTRDSQYLADLFSRPFARLFSVPIQIRMKTASDEVSSGVMYFEHSLHDNEKMDFVKFIEERLNLIGVALDRLFLEADLREASFIWERTFDEIADPVAIFDDDKKLVRSNKAFQVRFAGMEEPRFSEDNIHYDNRSFEVRRYPISAGDGSHSTNVVIHYLDVTLSHQLQKQMIQQEKMAALGHLAGNIAHELNNPLTGIQSMAQILSTHENIEKQIKEDLIEVDKAAERCQSIIKNLLDFSKGESEQKNITVELNHIVENTLPLLKTLVSMHSLDLSLTDQDSRVELEPQLFQQVVFNLIKNACQAMDEGGQLRISTSFESEDILLKIADNGSGMSEDIKEQIFDYFFTTKPKGEGTGLGLSMSRSIVQRFGGDIDVNSEVGRGTEFVIRLPKAVSQ